MQASNTQEDTGKPQLKDVPIRTYQGYRTEPDGGSFMSGQLDVLVASSDIEHRQTLVAILEGLSLNVISCSTLAQTKEVLSQRPLDLIFCDDHLADGCFRDLLPLVKVAWRTPRLVVTIRTGEWKEYLDAMGLGAFDAIRRPSHPTDVELIVLRAMHEGNRAADRAVA